MTFNLDGYFRNFKRQFYERMNFQNAILPAFTTYIKKEFKSKDGSIAKKYDIESAYLSVLMNPNFQLPESNIPSKILVNKDSNQYFQSISNEDKSFGIAKGFIVIPKGNELPFIPMRLESRGIEYSQCYRCLELGESDQNCGHSPMERGFFCRRIFRRFLIYEKIRL